MPIYSGIKQKNEINEKKNLLRFRYYIFLGGNNRGF